MRKFFLIVSLLGSLGAAGVAVAQSASEKESASRGAQDGCVGATHMTSEQHPMHDTMTTQQRHAKMVQHLQHGGSEKGPLSESMMGSMRGHHPDMMRGMH
jgi:hypothetical protein